MKNSNTKSGFIMQIILVIVALVLIKYIFHFDLIQWLQSPGPQNIIHTVWTYIQDVYTWVDKTVAGFGKK